jgi:hypothetical protein
MKTIIKNTAAEAGASIKKAKKILAGASATSNESKTMLAETSATAVQAKNLSHLLAATDKTECFPSPHKSHLY